MRLLDLNQPTLKQAKERTIENLRKPFSVQSEDGKIGSAVKTRFYTDLSRISPKLLQSKALQFSVKIDQGNWPKLSESNCKYTDCFKWRYTIMSNYSGYKLLHFSPSDQLLILGAINKYVDCNYSHRKETYVIWIIFKI